MIIQLNIKKQYLSRAIGAINGGNQLYPTSQCASKNKITSPLALKAPFDRVLISPSRSEFLINLTLPLNFSI